MCCFISRGHQECRRAQSRCSPSSWQGLLSLWVCQRVTWIVSEQMGYGREQALRANCAGQDCPKHRPGTCLYRCSAAVDHAAWAALAGLPGISAAGGCNRPLCINVTSTRCMPLVAGTVVAGAGSGRLLPNFDAPLYHPPALRDAAGPSGSPEMRRGQAFAAPQAPGPAKHVLPPPGFKQLQVCSALVLWSPLAAGQRWMLPDSILPQPHISECNLQAWLP